MIFNTGFLIQSNALKLSPPGLAMVVFRKIYGDVHADSI